MEIYAPDGAVGPPKATLAATPELLAGMRIGILDNRKPNADILLGRLAEKVAARTGAEVTLVETKNAALACEDQVLEKITKEVQVVLTGSAD